MPRFHIVFVGGIHGVGKTTFCQHLDQQLNVAYVAASTLIRQAGRHPSDTQKRVTGVQDNQGALLRGLAQYQTTAPALLLDGHFCLINQTSHIEKVPFSTFIGMAPSALLVLEDTIDRIHERLEQRDQTLHDCSLLTDLQACELGHAHDISRRLGVPLAVHHTSQMHIDRAIDFVRNYISA